MLLYCKLVIGKNYALFEVKFFRLKFGGCKESYILHVWPTPSLLLDYTFWPTTGLHLLAPTHPGLHPPGLHFRAYTSWPPPLQHGLISWPCIQYPVSRLQYNWLIQVKEEGWTGFSEGWQGCSEGFPEGKAQG